MKGLGRSGQGATEHIKVRVKNDSYGLGANATYEVKLLKRVLSSFPHLCLTHPSLNSFSQGLLTVNTFKTNCYKNEVCLVRMC